LRILERSRVQERKEDLRALEVRNLFRLGMKKRLSMNMRERIFPRRQAKRLINFTLKMGRKKESLCEFKLFYFN
jgi:hypothetical protein